MCRILILLLLNLGGQLKMSLFAQLTKFSTECFQNPLPDSSQVFIKVENKPYFIGGDDALLVFLLSNFNARPIINRLDKNERTFYDTARIVCIISKDKKMSDLTISSFKDTLFKNEIERLIKNSSCNWKPADFGPYVTSWYQFDIYFKFQRRRNEIELNFKVKHYDNKTE